MIDAGRDLDAASGVRVRAFAVWMLVLVAATVAAADLGYASSAFALVGHLPGRDKTGHFVIYGVLSLAVNLWAIRSSAPASMAAVLRTTTVLAVIVTLEELSQIYFASRSFSGLDLVASLAGTIGAAGLLAACHRIGKRGAARRIA